MIQLASTRGSGFSGFGSALRAWYEEKIAGVDKALAEVAEDTAEKGKNLTQYHIETRGTAKSGKRGRVQTGLMRDSVSGVSERTGRNKARAQFGWISKSPDYAIFQERGFNHPGGNYVEGMFALADAADEVVFDLKEDLEKRIRDV